MLSKKVEETIPTLNHEQNDFFRIIKNQLDINEGGIYCLEAHGGTGKSYLLNLILAEVRQRGEIALAVASSGIAATLLEGGRTAHSVFKLPLNIREIENPMCFIEKNSEKASLLKECKIIVWDESTLAHKLNFQVLDRTLRDIKNNDNIMGGTLMILSGDFRQILPVIPRGTPGDEIEASLKSSFLWPMVKKYKLQENMRTRINTDTNRENFAKKLLEIGDGKLETDEEGLITFPDNFCNFAKSKNYLINKIFTNLETNYKNDEWLCERAIFLLRMIQLIILIMKYKKNCQEKKKYIVLSTQSLTMETA